METDIDARTLRTGGPSGISFEAAGLLKDIQQLMERDRRGAHTAALRLASLLKQPENPGSAAARGGLAPWQMRKIDRYLRATLDRTVRVEDLAKQVSLSASYFSGAFKTSFGATPHMYIIRLRLERAKTLMLTTRDSLSQIALLCGLADQAHLSKLFRREVGDTPGAWRRRNLWRDPNRGGPNPRDLNRGGPNRRGPNPRGNEFRPSAAVLT